VARKGRGARGGEARVEGRSSYLRSSDGINYLDVGHYAEQCK